MAGFADNEYLFTSESVTEGHPDKVADQISDGVLDAVLAQDPYGRVACETLVNTGLVVISGEISTTADFDPQEVARETIRKIGYVDGDLGFSADSARGAQRAGQAVLGHRAGRRRGAGGARGRRTTRRSRRRRGRPGDDVRLRVQRDARADARADQLRPSAGRAARGGPQGRLARVPASGRQDAGVGPLRGRPAGRRSRSC